MIIDETAHQQTIVHSAGNAEFYIALNVLGTAINCSSCKVREEFNGAIVTRRAGEASN